MVEGLFVNRKLGRVSFVKELESGRILNEKGICAKAPVSFVPFLVKQGRGRRDAGAAWAGGSGRDGGHGVGEKRE